MDVNDPTFVARPPVGLVGLATESASAAQAGAPFPPCVDPSGAMMLSGMAAHAQQQPGTAPAHPERLAQQLQCPSQPGPHLSTAHVLPALAPAPESSGGPRPMPMPLQFGAAQPGLPSKEELLPAAGAPGVASAALAAAEARAAADPKDPEAVSAALVARMAAAGASIIFEKSLTASDVSGGGRVVVPKSVAEQYFPRLEQPSGVSICATDLDGRTYTFKWRFWVNNSSRMYLLEGAGELHRNYGLEVGDVMVFAQKPDGSLVVAGRVANKSDFVKKPPAKRPATHAAGGAAAGPGARGRDTRPARMPPRPGGAGAAAPGGATDGAGAAVAEDAAGDPPGGLLDGSAARGRKRKAVVPAPAGLGPSDPRFRGGRGDDAVSLAVLDLEAPSDGIFRALVMQHVAPVPVGVALARNNRWTATLDVAGELYQAFFDTRDDAVEALMAAGVSP